MLVEKDALESDALGLTTYVLKKFTVGLGAISKSLSDAFESWSSNTKPELIWGRIEESKHRERLEIQKIGFIAVEVSAEPRRTITDELQELSETLRFREAEHSDRKWLREIARNSFHAQRHYHDPRIMQGVAGRRYEYWLDEAFDNSRKTVEIVQDANGERLAMFILEPESKKAVRWLLTALDPAKANKGLGKSIWAAAIGHCGKQGFVEISSRISLSNIPVVSLYLSHGFQMGNVNWGFHFTAPVTTDSLRALSSK